VKVKKLVLICSLVGVGFAISVVPVVAQRVVVAGEPLVANGTYCNVGAMAGATNPIGIVTNPCSLMVYSQNQVFNGSSWSYILSGLVAASGVTSASNNSLSMQSVAANSTTLNVAVATQIKATAGQVFKISVVTAGSAGQLCDNNGACAAANVVATIPAVVGVYDIMWRFGTGIRVEPGTSQVVAISYQ